MMQSNPVIEPLKRLTDDAIHSGIEPETISWSLELVAVAIRMSNAPLLEKDFELLSGEVQDLIAAGFRPHTALAMVQLKHDIML